MPRNTNDAQEVIGDEEQVKQTEQELVDPVTNQTRQAFETQLGDDPEAQEIAKLTDRSLRGGVAARQKAAEDQLAARKRDAEDRKLAEERLANLPEKITLSDKNVMMPPEMYRAQEVARVKAEVATLKLKDNPIGGKYLVNGVSVNAFGDVISEKE